MATVLDLQFGDPAGSATAADSAGPTAEDGTFENGATTNGNGQALFDGNNDYLEVDPDPALGLSEGTVFLQFTQDTASQGDVPFGRNAAQTLFSVDSSGFDAGGHLTIFIRSDGSVGVRHQDTSDSFNFSGGSVTLGQPTSVAYSWGPSGSTLVVDGVVVDSGTQALVLGADAEPIVVGASQAQSGNGVANRLRGEFDGSIDRVLISDTADAGSVPCFTAGTWIETVQGARKVETLAVGDVVMTQAGPRPITWMGRWRIKPEILEARPNLCPVVFEPGSIGNARRLKLSRQHCVVMQRDGQMVLVRAGHLAKHADGRVRVSKAQRGVEYVHLLLDCHTAVRANGVLAESLYPGALALEYVRTDILTDTPEECDTFLPVLKSAEVKAAIDAGTLSPAPPMGQTPALRAVG